MTKTVIDYQTDIMNAQSEISKIQASCQHDKGYDCVMYSYRVGAFNPTRMCNECQSCLPGITSEEYEQVRKANGFWSPTQAGYTITVTQASEK